MGGGLETSDPSDKPGTVIYPSEVRTYTYCPRLFFFESWTGKKPGLRGRLRAFVGLVVHRLWNIIDTIRGFDAEKVVETRIGGVRLRGRPDSYKQADDEIVVIERKSGKGPMRGAWLSDALQASAYAFILSRSSDARKARIIIKYRRRGAELYMDEALVGKLFKALEDMVYIKKHGILPVALRSPSKCNKCAFRDPCYSIDEELTEEHREALYEVGSWLQEEKRSISGRGPG